MIRKVFRPIKWVLVATGLFIILLLLPIGYIETFCKSDSVQSTYQPILDNPEQQRFEGNSYLTYPEWHIVYAYEGLANVLKEGDEHLLNYSASIFSFWRSFCALNKVAGDHGGADFATRSTIHTIGVSYSLEMVLKGAYEETIGRLFAMMRGATKAPQDIYAAQMAGEYEKFLRQTPWYKFDFDNSTDELWQQPFDDKLRGWERRLALGGEWKAKAAYAKVIASAVAASGEAKLAIFSVVSGLSSTELASIDGVEIIDDRSDQIIIKTPRYRAFTGILTQIIDRNGLILEIAGNDDIMVSATTSSGDEPVNLNNGNIITQIGRDGYQGRRLLIDIRIQQLPQLWSELKEKGMVPEHVYDY